MKKLLVMFLILCCFLSVCLAQEPASASGGESPKISVRFDALGLLFFMFPVSGEYTLTDSITVTADVLYSPNVMWVSNISLFDIVAGGRYYFGALLPEGLPALLEGPAPFGPFAGARVGFDHETWNWGSGYKATYTAFGLGVEAGLKYFLEGRRGFYAEGVAGYMYYFPSTWKWTLDGASYTWTGAEDPDFNPSRLTYGVSIGYAF